MSRSAPGFNVNEPYSDQEVQEPKMFQIPPGTTHLWLARIGYGVQGSCTIEGMKILHVGQRFLEYLQPNGVIRSVELDIEGFSRTWSLTQVGALEKALVGVERQLGYAKKSHEDYVDKAMRLRDQIADVKGRM